MRPSPSDAHALRSITLACLATLAGSTAQAQSTGSSEAVLDTIVVTAQKRLERLQDVPVSVKAFSSRQIEAAGITSTQDFVNLTPNMSFDQSFTYGNSFVVLRGVTQINNADSPVAVVVDGVPQGNQKQLRMNLFDIERIEVLKGPQGALYGRNAIGGAINIETRKPGNALEGFAGLGYGEGNTRELSAGISGAVIDDKLMLRAAGLSKRSDGLINNSFLNRKVDAVDRDDNLRLRLSAVPSDEVQIDLRASRSEIQAGATYDSVVRLGGPSSAQLPRSSFFGRTTGRTDDASAKLDVDMPFGRLTAVTSWTDLTERYRGDLDFSNPVDQPGGFLGFGFQAGQGQNLAVRMLSQELRFTSPDNKPTRWIAGAYYLGTKRDLETHAFIDTNGLPEQFDEPAKRLITLAEHNDNKATALFGQLDVDFGTQWTLSTALRLDRDRREQTDLSTGVVRSASYSKWQPKATLTWKLARDTVAYGTASTGFRSGGFNAPGIADFKPETLTNLELGYKTVLLKGTLLLNSAVFAARSNNFQYFIVDAVRSAQIITNIDRVDLKGLDVDWRWLAARGLEIDGGLGITDSTIKRNSAEPGTIGNHTPKSVPYKLNLGVQYGTPVGIGLQAIVRADWEHRDRKFWHADNAAVSPALDLFGLRIGLKDAKDRWSVTLVGRNLGNKAYYADYNDRKYSGLPYDIGWRATPRTVSLEAKVRL